MYRTLSQIQSDLKVGKTQRNTFGNYNYRSCEDILEAVKPLCLKYDCVLTLSDEIIMIGDRIYVKSTALLTDMSEDRHIKSVAFAREEETKKGMDASQITGAASSYARKYALNGLFCIDDTKDADANNKHEAEPGKGDLELVKKQLSTSGNMQALNAISESASKLEWTKEERAELKQMFEKKRSELK